MVADLGPITPITGSRQTPNPISGNNGALSRLYVVKTLTNIACEVLSPGGLL